MSLPPSVTTGQFVRLLPSSRSGSRFLRRALETRCQKRTTIDDGSSGHNRSWKKGSVCACCVCVRGLNSAREPDSSFGGVPVVNCLGVVHMEEEIQDRVQVEVGREEQGMGETHGKEQGEEQGENRQSIAQHG